MQPLDALGALRIAFAALALLAVAAAAAGSWSFGHVPHMRRWFAVGSLAAAAFVAVAAAVAVDGTAARDAFVLDAAIRMPEGVVGVAAALAVAGGALAVLPLVGVACAVQWRRGRHGEALRLALAMGLTALVGALVKLAFARARPEEAVEVLASESFPSGHTAAAAALGTWLVRRGAEHLGWRPRVVVPVLLACAWVVVMAASRVALRVHYASDVVGGAALGVAVSAFVFSSGIPARLRGPRPGRVDEATVEDPAAA